MRLIFPGVLLVFRRLFLCQACARAFGVVWVGGGMTENFHKKRCSFGLFVTSLAVGVARAGGCGANDEHVSKTFIQSL